MDVEALIDRVNGIPHMTPEEGRYIDSFLREHQLRNCLELGFAHGVGTAFLANAVRDMGGRVSTIDLVSARERQPDILTTLQRAGVDSQQVDIYFEPTSYNWRMMKFLQEGRGGTFDFVYLDGAHSWAVDGLAFHLSKLLLRPGGWLLFDDLNWTFDTSSVAAEDWVQRMPAEERKTPQVRLIWDLLVKSDPEFVELVERDDWAFARKRNNGTETKVIYRYHPVLESVYELKNLARATWLGLKRRRSSRGGQRQGLP